jgi:hypothetical protein
VKFVTVRIPVTVESDGDGTSTVETVSVSMFVHEDCGHAEAASRLGDLLRNKLNTVDLGDDE